ncbi:MAG TPA: cytidine deaminase [Alphaproteobacteria bacterium]|nr:cytidine deaminase [Alphaproteobacteria bacterium]
MATPPDDLFQPALAAYRNAYAPYSKFNVGAAVRTADGRIFAGCNVENAAYPQGHCAESSALGAMATAGGRQVVEVVVVGGQPGDGLLCTPCGGCRQRLREFCPPDAVVHVCGPEGLRKTYRFAELLPDGFGPDNLR